MNSDIYQRKIRTELACGRVKQEYRSDLLEEFTEEYKHFVTS